MKKLLLYLVLFTSAVSGANGNPVLPDFSNWPVFDVKSFGAIGDGVADDSTAFAATLRAVKAAGKGVVSIPAGGYFLNTATTTSTWVGRSKISLLVVPDVPIVVKGAGTTATRLITSSEATIFDGTTSNSADLTLIGLTMACLSGFSSASNSYGVLFAGQALRAQGVEFDDFTQAIRIPEGARVPYVLVDQCTFVYSHGRAGVSQADPSFGYPVTAILGGGVQTEIYNSYFNGLSDPAFQGVTVDKATGNQIDPSQFTPVDGLIKTINQVQSATIRGSTIQNAGIEHILIDGGGDSEGPWKVDISQNQIVGPGPNYIMTAGNSRPQAGQIQTHSSFFSSAIVGIQITGGYGSITGNQIINVGTGISSCAYGTAQYQPLTVSNNRLTNCMVGITMLGSQASTVSNNDIEFSRPFTDLERQSGAPAAHTGVRPVDSPNSLITENHISLQSDRWWQGETTLLHTLRSGARVAYINSTIATGAPIWIYFGSSPYWPIMAVGYAAGPGKICLYAPLPLMKILPPGSPVKWTTGNLPQQAGVSSFRSSSALSYSNTFTGGLFGITQLEGNGVIFSKNDTFVGYVNPLGWGVVAK
jgi:parallel beta-helix repeat protein